MAPPPLSPATQDFLRYVKKRIVDGELNKKQKAGIVLGMATGAGVAWPLMVIFFDGILSPYASYLFSYYVRHCPPTSCDLNSTSNVLTTQFKNFNSYLNFYTMMGLVGIPMGIDAASRTAVILSSLGEENTTSFSLQKNKNHRITLLFTKGSLYFGSIIAGFLPVYYLYDSLLGCHIKLEQAYFAKNSTDPCFALEYEVHTNIFLDLNISGDCLNDPPDFANCTRKWDELPSKSFYLFGIGAPFVWFDIVLQYGHQLTSYAIKWINDYFFSIMRASSRFSSVESIRQGYVTQFRELKRLIFELDEGGIDDLYDAVFLESTKTSDQDTGVSFEERTQNDAIRILKVFNEFYRQHKNSLEEEETENWKKTCASCIGWAISLIATFGRMVIFQNIIESLLGQFWYDNVDVFNHNYRHEPSTGATILSYFLGGLFANVTQGFIEKEAVEESIYDLLGSKKIQNGSSHKSLRTGIKIWDCIYGIFQTIPYLAVGYALTGEKFSAIPSWVIVFLLSFGIADAFNNVIAFHDSNLAVVDAYDSLKATYGTPSPEYKRDKLVRITRQLRHLFKDLDGHVLEEVDWLLNQEVGEEKLEVSDSLSIAEEAL
jgi:hypothetical protein